MIPASIMEARSSSSPLRIHRPRLPFSKTHLPRTSHPPKAELSQLDSTAAHRHLTLVLQIRPLTLIRLVPIPPEFQRLAEAQSIQESEQETYLAHREIRLSPIVMMILPVLPERLLYQAGFITLTLTVSLATQLRPRLMEIR